MRRIITIAALIIIAFTFQYTLISFHSLSGIAPNLLLILTMSFGIMRGRNEGMITGLFCGLLVDVFYNDMIGPYMLIYLLIGYFNGIFHRNYLMEDIMLPIIITLADQIIFETAVYFMKFFLAGRTDFGFYLSEIILPETMFTILMTVLLYRLLLSINTALKKKDKA